MKDCPDGFPVKVPNGGGLGLIFVGYVVGLASLGAFGASIYFGRWSLFVLAISLFLGGVGISWEGGVRIEEAKNRCLPT